MNYYFLKNYCLEFLENVYIYEFWELLFWHIVWKILDNEVAWRNFLYSQIHDLKTWGANS